MTRIIAKNECGYGDYPVELIGGKGSGLIKLKHLENLWIYNFDNIEIPNFFIIPTDCNVTDRETFNQVLYYADKLEADRFAVRSSSPFEDGKKYSFDGIFETILNVHNNLSHLELFKAIKEVKKSALSDRAKKYANDFGLKINDKMAVIVQKMIDEPLKGIIYSKFPASIDIGKIINLTKDDPKENVTLIRRKYDEKQDYATFGYKIIENVGLEDELAKDLLEFAYKIETEFKHPVRLEFQVNEESKRFYLLQARSVAGIKNFEKISLSQIINGELIIGAKNKKNQPKYNLNVNGTGDFTLPIVIGVERSEERLKNLSFESLRRLDKEYSTGYILLCLYLQFDNEKYDSVTPNKKAVIAASNLGRHHDLDIAREKGILYLGLENLYLDLSLQKVNLKTGDTVRLISDGIEALLYKINK